MSLAYYSSEVADASVYELTLCFEPKVASTTQAGIVSLPATNACMIAWTDAASPGPYTNFFHPTQAQIDAFLGTSSEFTEAKFNATVIDDYSAVGIIVNMEGQCKDVVGVTAMHLDALDVPDYQVGLDRALVSTALAASQIQVGADGNIGLQLKMTSQVANAATGLLVVKILWQPK